MMSDSKECFSIKGCACQEHGELDCLINIACSLVTHRF